MLNHSTLLFDTSILLGFLRESSTGEQRSAGEGCGRCHGHVRACQVQYDEPGGRGDSHARVDSAQQEKTANNVGGDALVGGSDEVGHNSACKCSKGMRQERGGVVLAREQVNVLGDAFRVPNIDALGSRDEFCANDNGGHVDDSTHKETGNGGQNRSYCTVHDVFRHVS